MVISSAQRVMLLPEVLTAKVSRDFCWRSGEIVLSKVDTKQPLMGRLIQFSMLITYFALRHLRNRGQCFYMRFNFQEIDLNEDPLNRSSSAFYSCARVLSDGIIYPRDTRKVGITLFFCVNI